MNLNWWYNLVAKKLVLDHARLVDNLRYQTEIVQKLRADVTRLERPTEIGSWIHSREFAAGRRIEELELQLAKMGLLRDALRNEKAYTLFLEDGLKVVGDNPCDMFNALPSAKRKEYFDKVQ